MDGFKPLLGKLVDGRVLTPDEAHAFFSACLRGEPTPSQVAAAVTALRIRGETVDEIVAFATAMRDAALSLDHPFDDVIDTCGTGGDGQHTYNVSTAAAFVLASLRLNDLNRNIDFSNEKITLFINEKKQLDNYHKIRDSKVKLSYVEHTKLMCANYLMIKNVEKLTNLAPGMDNADNLNKNMMKLHKNMLILKQNKMEHAAEITNRLSKMNYSHINFNIAFGMYNDQIRELLKYFKDNYSDILTEKMIILNIYESSLLAAASLSSNVNFSSSALEKFKGMYQTLYDNLFRFPETSDISGYLDEAMNVINQILNANNDIFGLPKYDMVELNKSANQIVMELDLQTAKSLDISSYVVYEYL